MTTVLPHPVKMGLADNGGYLEPKSDKFYTKMDITLSLMHEATIDGITDSTFMIAGVNNITLGEYSYVIRYDDWKRTLIMPYKEVVAIDGINK